MFVKFTNNDHYVYIRPESIISVGNILTDDRADAGLSEVTVIGRSYYVQESVEGVMRLIEEAGYNASTERNGGL